MQAESRNPAPMTKDPVTNADRRRIRTNEHCRANVRSRRAAPRLFSALEARSTHPGSSAATTPVRLATMRQPEFDEFFKSLKPLQRAMLDAGLTPDQREVVGALENPDRLVVEELTAQRLTRDIYSTAQLQEVMTDFWLNHFNVYLRKNETDALLPGQL